MNVIDIIILLILAFAIFEGARNGLIIQGVSIVSVVLGIWLGMSCGGAVAKMFGITGGYASMWGFIIVLIATLLLLTVAAHMLRRLLQFVGFGLLDLILGAVLSTCKFLIILSLVFTMFDLINHTYVIVEHKQIEGSLLYRPIANISKLATPVWEWTQDQLNAS